MKAVLEMPNDSVSQLESMLHKRWIQRDIKRNNFPGIDVVAHLPANAAFWSKYANAFVDNGALPCKILFQCAPLLVSLT